jgi:MFS family permease
MTSSDVERTYGADPNEASPLEIIGPIHRDGRYVLDPEEARIEYGDEIASKLKLSKKDKYVLWPQPTDNPEDPQNWSDGKKALMLFIATIAAFVPDFCSGVGIATLFNLAAQFNTSVNNINNLTSNWSIFLLGPGGVIAVLFIRRFGRLPVMFWSQVFGLAFQLGCTFSPNLTTFAAMRCLNAFFSTAPQVTGLYTIIDMFPVHLVHRKITIWTFGYVVSPFVSPWLLGYLAARQSWRWAYGVSCFYMGFVVFMIAFFFEETLYDRDLRPIPPRPTSGLRYRIETLLGVTGWKLRKYRTTMFQAAIDVVNVLWRPQFLLTAIIALASFGFTIGINVTNPVFLGSPEPIGYGYKQDIVSTIYLTPIIGVLLGEIFAKLFNQFAVYLSVRRDKGVFESEDTLIGTIPGLIIYVAGMVLFGWTIEHKANISGVIFGWGFVQIGNVFIIVAVLAYASANFPTREGECSALLNWARILGGFAVPYFQTKWVQQDGALQSFGVEGAAVAGVWMLTIPILLWKGKQIRDLFSIKGQHPQFLVGKTGPRQHPKISDLPDEN